MTTNDEPSQHHQPETTLPTTSELEQISTLLKDEPIPKVLSRRRTIPRTLLIAAKRGIRESSGSEQSGTKSLVDSLLSLSKASIIAKLRNQKVVKPSPFSRTRAAQTDREQLQTITKAATWATTLLTDCIRGTSDPNDTQHQSSARASISHQGTGNVFVAPRDAIDPVLARRYAEKATGCLRNRFFRENLSALVNIQAFLISATVKSPVHIHLYKPILERAISTIASASYPLLASEPTDRSQKGILERAIDSPHYQSGPLAFLSAEAKASLCVQRPAFRKSLWAQVDEIFASQRVMPYTTECRIVSPLARAAVIEITFHWELMDHVRNLLSGNEAPFSLALWNKRYLYRALFSEILRLISSKETLKINHASLIRRYPPFGRPLVHVLSSLSTALQSEDVRQQRKAVDKAGRLIWKGLNNEENLVWTPNMHGLMICIESFLELFCWAATFSIDLQVLKVASKGRHKQHLELDILNCVCYLSSLIEVSRLPGGAMVESKAEIQTAVYSKTKILLQLLQKHQLNLKPANAADKRVGGLFAFAISGILGRQDVDLTAVSFPRISMEGKECMSRSFEKSASWTTDRTVGSRYDKARRMLADHSVGVS